MTTEREAVIQELLKAIEEQVCLQLAGKPFSVHPIHRIAVQLKTPRPEAA